MGNCMNSKVNIVPAHITKMDVQDELEAGQGKAWLFTVETDQDAPKHLDHKPNISGAHRPTTSSARRASLIRKEQEALKKRREVLEQRRLKQQGRQVRFKQANERRQRDEEENKLRMKEKIEERLNIAEQNRKEREQEIKQRQTEWENRAKQIRSRKQEEKIKSMSVDKTIKIATKEIEASERREKRLESIKEKQQARKQRAEKVKQRKFFLDVFAELDGMPKAEVCDLPPKLHQDLLVN